jgi:histidinol phosphatase-like enzyme
VSADIERRGCPYHPLHGIGEYRREHPWRKPNPGMILQAIFDPADRS